MTNKELAELLRSAASALEHGRYATANKKLKAITNVEDLQQERLEAFFTVLAEAFDNDAPAHPGALVFDPLSQEDMTMDKMMRHLRRALDLDIHPDTGLHRAACGSCMMEHDKHLPDYNGE